MAKKGFFKEFKEFATKGNVIDMAVGVVIGGAFSKIVTALVNNVITPFIGLLSPDNDVSGLKWVIRPEVAEEVAEDGTVIVEGVAEAAVTYGVFLQNVIDFIIIAFSIFLMVKAINKLKSSFGKAQRAEAEAAAKAKADAEAAAKAEAEAKAAAEKAAMLEAYESQKETAKLLSEIKELINKK